MAGRTKTAGARASATGRRDGNTKQSFRLRECLVSASAAIAAGALNAAWALALIVLVGAS